MQRGSAPIIHHPTVSGTFYTARQSIYKSTNNGSSWISISNNVNGTDAVRELAQSKTDPNIMFATSGSQVFKSTDEGVNWTNVTAGLPSRTITSVYVHPTNSNEVLLTFSGFGTSKVYKSINGGSTWITINGNLPDSPVNDLLLFTNHTGYPNTYFAATDIGVFVTTDNGVDWVEIGNGLPNTVIMHLDYSPSNNKLRAGTHGRGVYETVVDFGNPVSVEDTFTPSEINISQNYPNPFNPSTTIKYSINQDGRVRLAVYNPIGQEVEELIAAYQTQGTYETVWNAGNRASGIYFYLFELIGSNGELIHKEMKKLVLIK